MMTVIQAGAMALATYTNSVAKWLEFSLPPVRLLGGLFLHQPLYGDLYRSYLAEMIPTASVEVCRTPGAFGAAWLAAGKDTTAPEQLPPLSVAPSNQLDSAITEDSNPRSVDLDRMNTRQLVDLFVSEETFVEAALKSCRDELCAAVDLLAEALRQEGRVFYVGAGSSGRIGVLDASEIPATFGEPPDRFQGIIAGGPRALSRSVEGAEDDALQGELAIVQRGVGSSDVVCGLAASGRTPYVLAALRKARQIGAKTLLITCNPARPGKGSFDIEIDMRTGPELITGSTRLKAGTATKVALNILSSCAMIRLGRVVGNLMVNINPTSGKLRYRAVRLVSKLRGCSREEAERLLHQSGWNIRRALSS